MIKPDYIFLDAARLGSHINTAWDLTPRFDSLYRGASRSNLAIVAPYLFTFPPNTPFSQWYAEYGFGDHWGVLFTSNASFEECHKHFRKFLKVKTASGKELYFRFYDPRVLKIFLPSCTAPQLIEFFGPITAFIVEGNTAAECIIFSHNDGALQQQNMAATDLFLAK